MSEHGTASPAMPHILVPACDLEAARALDLPATLLGVPDAGDRGPAQPVCAVALLCLSAQGRATAEALCADWPAYLADPAPPLCDLSTLDGAAQAQAALRATAQGMAAALGSSLHQRADLLGQLAALRATHEDQSLALSRAEALLEMQARGGGWPVQDHAPLATEAEDGFRLQPADSLRQRLALGSDGISALALFLPEQSFATDGQLSVRLEICGSGEEAARWTVAAPDLSRGWLHLGRARALPDDPQNIDLVLDWQGTGPLVLGAGLHHPARTLCATLAGVAQDRILAHRLWKFLPGRAVAVPLGAHLAEQSAPGWLYLPPEMLAGAVSADAERAGALQFHDALGALQVHPQPQGLSAARLDGALPSGIARIEARVMARAPFCPPMEYALAAVPRHPLRPLGDLVEEAARAGHVCDWMRRAGVEEGCLTLHLPAPLQGRHDLLLLTRVPEGGGAAYGWATFRDIRMSA